jgi:outer membrane cobalamin receptor
MLTYRKTWGEDRVFFYDGGRLRALPASWTDAAPVVPFVTIAAGRAHFRPDDLLRLVELVEALRVERSTTGKVSGKLRRLCKVKCAKNGGHCGVDRKRMR